MKSTRKSYSNTYAKGRVCSEPREAQTKSTRKVEYADFRQNKKATDSDKESLADLKQACHASVIADPSQPHHASQHTDDHESYRPDRHKHLQITV